MPATTQQDQTSDQKKAGDATEVFLSPRVVDETAFRAFSDRLRELVDRADRAQASLSGLSGESSEALKSLEAMTHTQTRKAREIREALDRVDATVRKLDEARARAAKEAERIAGHEKRTATELTERVRKLGDAGREIEERAAEASAALDERLARAETGAAALGERLAEATAKLESLEGIEETTAELRALVKDASERESALREVRDFGEQAQALLSAMRGTILECAEARDAADARLERLKAAAAKANAAAERAENAEPATGEVDIEAIVRSVEQRVLRALESRVEKMIERAMEERGAPPETNGNEALAEIQRSIEMLSGVTLGLTQREAEVREELGRLREIPAMDEPGPRFRLASSEADEPEVPEQRVAPVRSRRATAAPVGANGELGDAGALRMLWSWTEGAS
jgi:chromosome segregation ATPase